MPDNSYEILSYRVAQVEKEMQEASKNRKDIYNRLDEIEKFQAVHSQQYETIIQSLNELKEEVKALTSKEGNKWDTLVKSIITGLSGGILGYIVSKIFN